MAGDGILCKYYCMAEMKWKYLFQKRREYMPCSELWH